MASSPSTDRILDYDGTFIRGMVSSMDISAIPMGSYEWSMNMVHRGGVLMVRPGYRCVVTLPLGRVQGAFCFRPKFGIEQMVVVVDGNVWVADYPFATDYRMLENVRFSPDAPQIYFCLADQFVSLRLIKEALEKKFTLRILDESTHELRCKVTRYVRLYAAPMPFPNPALEVSFKNDEHETVINYRIKDYDYYLVLIVVLLGGLSAVGLGLEEGLIEALRIGLLFSTLSLIFFGSLVLIDARVFAYRIKNALLNMGKSL